jgi:pantothenate kinase
MPNYWYVVVVTGRRNVELTIAIGLDFFITEIPREVFK